MHLKAIKLRGFKSFVDPVEIHLEPGVAVVVGPNGSGKSNVSDSILWATGSMSPGELLESAGFTDVEVHRVEAPLELASAAECTQLERESFGALHQMLEKLPAGEQDDAWCEIEAALAQFEQDGRFVGPCELLVGAGTN